MTFPEPGFTPRPHIPSKFSPSEAGSQLELQSHMLLPALLLSEKPTKTGVCVSLSQLLGQPLATGAPASLGLRAGRLVNTVPRGQPRPLLRCYYAWLFWFPMPPLHPTPASRPGKVNRNRKGSLEINQGWKGSRKEKSIMPLLV